MVDIVTRTGKGSALTFTEMDANLTNLKAGIEACALPSIYAAQVLADSPVAYWRFNDAYGPSSYADASGNAYNLTATSGYFVPVPGGLVGDTDRGMYMTSDGKYAKLPSGLASAWPTSSNLTVEAIVKTIPLNSTAYGVILSMSPADSSNISRIWFCVGNGSSLYPTFIVDDASATDAIVTSPFILPFDVWTHLCATYDGSTVKLYINGDLVASTSKSVTIAQVARTAAYVNRSNWASNTAQQSLCLDELALYNTCLSATRIAEHAKYMRGATS